MTDNYEYAPLLNRINFIRLMNIFPPDSGLVCLSDYVYVNTNMRFINMMNKNKDELEKALAIGSEITTAEGEASKAQTQKDLSTDDPASGSTLAELIADAEAKHEKHEKRKD